MNRVSVMFAPKGLPRPLATWPRLAILPALAALAAVGLWGCAPSGRVVEPIGGGESIPEGAVFNYRVTTCDCFHYRVENAGVGYTFQATYRMEGGIVTEITISLENRSSVNLDLAQGSVKVYSRNIKYQYNDKFVPLPDMTILPGGSEELKFTGAEVTDQPDWRRIAGEQLTFTISRLRHGDRVVPNQVVTFVPENPLLQPEPKPESKDGN